MSRLWPHACNAANRSNFRWGGVAVPTCPAASSAWEVGKLLVKMVNYVWIRHQRHVRRHVQGGPKISRVTCAVCLATGPGSDRATRFHPIVENPKHVTFIVRISRSIRSASSKCPRAKAEKTPTSCSTEASSGISTFYPFYMFSELNG